MLFLILTQLCYRENQASSAALQALNTQNLFPVSIQIHMVRPLAIFCESTTKGSRRKMDRFTEGRDKSAFTDS